MKRTIFTVRSLKILGSRRSALDTARGRLVLLSAGFVLAYILVVARAMDVSVIQRGQESDPRAAMAVDAPVRADIIDRNGVLLATSLKTPSLYADPAHVLEPEKTAKALVKILPDLSYGETLQKLQRKARFVWIRRNLTPKEQYEILKIGDPGLSFQDELRRIYPQGDMAVHMVGYTDVDGHGLAGVERSFDKYLASGKNPLRLTLDTRIQYILHRETQDAVRKFNAKAGAGVVLDVATGEVLAAVSLPDFDPHDVSSANAEAQFNRLTLGVYEMGSTFKIFSTAALLELTGAPLSTEFDAREPLKYGRFRISDYHPEKRVLTVPEVFMYSSNIGSALMGEKVGTKAFKKFYEDLGFFAPLKFEIDEIGRPLVPKPWREINTLTASFGHGVAVSPLQMVSAASSIVGGGILSKPALVISDTPEKRKADIRIVSPQTAHRMRQLMRLVVEEGTGTKANVPGYNVGGKTGTSEKPGIKGYDRSRLLSSFIGFFPMEKPRYAVFIMVDEPRGNAQSFGYATGGWVAAPAVARVITGMAAVLGIKPSSGAEGQDMLASLRRYIHDKAEGEGQNATSY